MSDDFIEIMLFIDYCSSSEFYKFYYDFRDFNDNYDNSTSVP